jgi:perosamine synthetase
MNDDARDRYRARIGETLGVPGAQVTLFAKGRVALYGILRALGIGPGDEVILPAFTCVAVPNAIIYAGARPIYADIDATTYTIDPASVEGAITSRTRAILAQNTYGLSADLDTLGVAAANHGLVVIDDCTHGLGGEYAGRPNGSVAAASFFSTQWSKPISTGLGGFAVARDHALAGRLRDIENGALEPSLFRSGILRVLAFGADRAGQGRAFRAGRSAYRALSRSGLVPGSSAREELEGIAMPDGFLTRLSGWQARLGSARLRCLSADVQRRRSIAQAYSAWLVGHGRTAAAEPAGSTHAFLRYPLRVNDRPAVIREAERALVDLGDWFVSPIHPVLDRLERWGYEPGLAPVAELACAEIVNLPTGPGLSDREVERVLRFLAENAAAVR